MPEPSRGSIVALDVAMVTTDAAGDNALSCTANGAANASEGTPPKTRVAVSRMASRLRVPFALLIVSPFPVHQAPSALYCTRETSEPATADRIKNAFANATDRMPKTPTGAFPAGSPSARVAPSRSPVGLLAHAVDAARGSRLFGIFRDAPPALHTAFSGGNHPMTGPSTDVCRPALTVLSHPGLSPGSLVHPRRLREPEAAGTQSRIHARWLTPSNTYNCILNKVNVLSTKQVNRCFFGVFDHRSSPPCRSARLLRLQAPSAQSR